MYKNKKVVILFLAPLLIFMAVFLFIPFLTNIKNSFLGSSGEFIGLKNYIAIFSRQDGRFYNALINTMILMLLVIIFQVGFALVLALLVNRVGKSQAFYKISYFIPIILSGAVIGLMFDMFYRYSDNPAKQGAFNQILIFLNFSPVNWITSEGGRMAILMAVSLPVVWQYIGFYFVIFLTGLATIPSDLLEAASIDGANEFQKVFRLEIPLLQNVIRVVFVLAITGTLKVFDLPYILNGKSWPNHEGFFLGTLLNYYRLSESVGKAASFAVIIVVFGILMSMISNVLFKQNTDI